MRYSITVRELLTIPMRLRIHWYLLPVNPPKVPDVQYVPEYDVEDWKEGWK